MFSYRIAFLIGFALFVGKCTGSTDTLETRVTHGSLRSIHCGRHDKFRVSVSIALLQL